MKHPLGCQECAIEHSCTGFTLPQGPPQADILIITESPLEMEVAGQKLDSLLRKVGLAREHIRLQSILSGKPPGKKNKLGGKPFEDPAIWHCQQYLNPVLQEAHRVILPLGPIPTRVILKQAKRKFALNNWHGQPSWVDGRWVVASYAPSLLQEGKQNLSEVVRFDLLRAKQVLEGRFQEEPATLIVDPPLEWFRYWIQEYKAAIQQNPELFLAIDTETVEKMKGQGEDDLKGDFPEIVRINFSWKLDEGITVPWKGEYIELAKELLLTPFLKLMHNCRYDRDVLRGAGIDVPEPIHDTMGLFKVLQSDLPRGLGFIAPFYSRYIHPETKSGAWKHLSGVNPGEYAAIDGVQTLRIGYGVKKDLQKSGQWDRAYMRHNYELRTSVLEPAENVGLKINRDKLREFGEKLRAKEALLLGKLQGIAGEDAKPWVGGAGNKGLRKPKKGEEEKWVAREVEEDIYCCTGECGMRDVGKAHKCKKEKLPKIPKIKTPKLPKVRTIRNPRRKKRDEAGNSDSSDISNVLSAGDAAAAEEGERD